MIKQSKIWAIFLNFLLIFLLISCQNQEKITGIPVNFQRVVSGNTIEVLWTKEGVTSLQTIRLMGIKAPDLKQDPWGKQAQQKLNELLTFNPQSLDLKLELDQDQPDQYGRFWAFVWYENQLMNEKIVKEGFALVDLCPPILPKKETIIKKKDLYCNRLLNAQQYARLMNFGIWDPAFPMREML